MSDAPSAGVNSKLALPRQRGAWEMPRALWPFLVPILVLAALWWRVIYQLLPQWSLFEQYAYGRVVPILCLYLFWARWSDRPRDFAANRGESSSSGPCWGWRGLFLLLALLLLPTRLLLEANPVWRLPLWVLGVAAVGLTLLLLVRHGGWAWGRHFGFAVALFLVAIPWPTALELAVTKHLMRANVAITAELLWWVNIPAMPEGNVIRLSQGLVGIDEACSGIRSLQTCLMIALFLGGFYKLGLPQRVLLCAASVGFTFVFNVGRTFLLSNIGARQGIPAIDRWHDLAGTAILLGCCLCLWSLSQWLGRRTPPERRVAASDTSQRSEAGADEARRVWRSPLWSWGVGLGVWLVVVEAGTEVWFRLHEQRSPTGQTWGLKWPPVRPEFNFTPISRNELAQLGCDENASGAWKESDGSFWRLYHFRWIPSRTLARRVAVNLAKCHAPDHCLVSAGKKLRQDFGTVSVRLEGYDFPFQKMLFDDHGQNLLVFYGVFEDELSRFGTVHASRRRNASERVAAALTGSRNYGQQMIQVAVWGFADVAQAEAAFVREMKGMLRMEPGRGPGDRLR